MLAPIDPHEHHAARKIYQTHRMNRHAADDVLIVDDEAEIARMIADVLRDEGYQVRMAHDGASALLEIAARRPGLVFLDVAMPVMVGNDLLRYLRSHGYGDLPVVMMTAGLRPQIYLSQGADAVLAKPFDIDAMLDVVYRLMPRERAFGAERDETHYDA